VLDDTAPCRAGLGHRRRADVGQRADATVVYADLGLNAGGMDEGIKRAERDGRPVD